MRGEFLPEGSEQRGMRRQRVTEACEGSTDGEWGRRGKIPEDNAGKEKKGGRESYGSVRDSECRRVER